MLLIKLLLLGFEWLDRELESDLLLDNTVNLLQLFIGQHWYLRLRCFLKELPRLPLRGLCLSVGLLRGRNLASQLAFVILVQLLSYTGFHLNLGVHYFHNVWVHNLFFGALGFGSCSIVPLLGINFDWTTNF